jgi:hypothetical protein
MSKVRAAVVLIVAFCFSWNLSHAEGSEDCKLSPIEGPHATAVVYRNRSFYGYSYHASIYVDEKKVCSLTNGRYVIIPLTPGEHTLHASDPKHGVMQQDFKEGLGYYFRAMLHTETPVQVTKFWVLTAVPPEKAKSDLKRVKPEDREAKPLPEVAAPLVIGALEVEK